MNEIYKQAEFIGPLCFLHACCGGAKGPNALYMGKTLLRMGLQALLGSVHE
jgi:hypothetical protein